MIVDQLMKRLPPKIFIKHVERIGIIENNERPYVKKPL